MRNLFDSKQRHHFAHELSTTPLTYLISEQSTPIYRNLPGVDKVLFENKKVNLILALKQTNGVLIPPGSVFSLWNCIGNPSATRGFLPGLIISKGRPAIGVGGGLCQLSNTLHWLGLQSEMTITERHRHSFDIFPDDSRNTPFGTGATIVYSYKDLRISNKTKSTVYQFWCQLHNDFLSVQLRCSEEPEYQFKVIEKDHQFHPTKAGLFRSNSIWQLKENRNGDLISSHQLFTNYCQCQYEWKQRQ